MRPVGGRLDAAQAALEVVGAADSVSIKAALPIPDMVRCGRS
jgi:hypothetical protein